MTRAFPEGDWAVFRKLRETALERFCERVLAEIRDVASGRSGSYHDLYLRVYGLIEQRDAELARAFNNPRRSDAFMQLAAIQRHNLLTPEEMSLFSSETREILGSLLQARPSAPGTVR